MTGAATGHLAHEETPETSADASGSEEDEAR